MRNFGNTGFTLLEVGLAITIGLIASSALVAFYFQVKDDSGDAAMKLRIGSLKSVVEVLYSAQGSCPGIGDIRNAWAAKRPSDFMKSVWGGEISYPTAPDDWKGIGPAAANSDVAKDDRRDSGVEENMTSGGLYYFRVYDTLNGATISSMLATASVWNQPTKTYVTITGYGIAGLKSANKYYMVTSGR